MLELLKFKKEGDNMEKKIKKFGEYNSAHIRAVINSFEHSEGVQDVIKIMESRQEYYPVLHFFLLKNILNGDDVLGNLTKDLLDHEYLDLDVDMDQLIYEVSALNDYHRVLNMVSVEIKDFKHYQEIMEELDPMGNITSMHNLLIFDMHNRAEFNEYFDEEYGSLAKIFEDLENCDLEKSYLVETNEYNENLNKGDEGYRFYTTDYIKEEMKLNVRRAVDDIVFHQRSYIEELTGGNNG